MLKVLALAVFSISLALTVMAQDPVKVDSKHYTVEFENSQVRVLRAKVGPHEKSIMHRHPNAVAIFVTDTNGKFTFPDGTTQDTNRKAGDVLWTPAVTHQPENTSDQPFEVILVELKQPMKKRPATKSAQHAAGKKH
ncbi:MAG: cupin domain-containing protein [Pyrinomonadaceae bacterium]